MIFKAWMPAEKLLKISMKFKLSQKEFNGMDLLEFLSFQTFLMAQNNWVMQLPKVQLKEPFL